MDILPVAKRFSFFLFPQQISFAVTLTTSPSPFEHLPGEGRAASVLLLREVKFAAWKTSPSSPREEEREKRDQRAETDASNTALRVGMTTTRRRRRRHRVTKSQIDLLRGSRNKTTFYRQTWDIYCVEWRERKKIPKNFGRHAHDIMRGSPTRIHDDSYSSGECTWVVFQCSVMNNFPLSNGN